MLENQQLFKKVPHQKCVRDKETMCKEQSNNMKSGPGSCIKAETEKVDDL